ncbi:hypothetical protein [Clostridium sp.]|jgi:hypothetical protein|uniref:hypothetical protein n=1 Tax=Clostridium sp. TaxID=1506 RepID=UPI003EEA18A1
MSTFKKVSELELINGGYLAAVSNGKYFKNNNFVDSQKKAEFLVKVALKMKGKTFTTESPSSISSIMNEVSDELSKETFVEFVAKPTTSKGVITGKLAKEALDFMQAQEDSEFIDVVNSRMQEFKVIQEFENNGLFFKEGITNLSRIYTIAEITAAVTVIAKVEALV